jgi:uncharacterized alpha-E superfamily protein
MILSRVANSLYWIGRYIERAENANRHIVVASEFAVELEGIKDKIAYKEWQSLVASMPSAGGSAVPDVKRVPEGSDAALKYMISFLVDKDNPYSVISSLSKARENARAVAETITFEITYNLNESHRQLSAIKPDSIKDPGFAHEVAAKTHSSILTTLGAIEHTLTRGEGWNYMKIGEAIERTQRTIFVLKTRLPSLAEWSGDAGNPLYSASWRSLLRSLASQENYRIEHGPRFRPEQVIRFLLFHPGAPRSVLCGVQRMIGYLKGISDPGPATKDARRRLGKLAAQLEFEQDEIVADGAIIPFLEKATTELYQIHECISNPMRLR